ncbi:MAG: UDP-N-acetylglucosamine 1-carboxyvinyltransferase [Bacillota bacterium]|nr:UDP-N-acetylglucosamine 1-carboxyvinyltransferase [Bacillota bacterium]
MEKYSVCGGNRLYGEINISGAKNAAVAIIPATVLVDGPCRIENVPKISDVTALLTIMREFGANIKLINDSTIEIDCSKIRNTKAPYELIRKIRASYYLIGALLGRYRCAEVGMPGGCDFGVRPIDQHVKGFESLGAKVDIKNGFIHATAENGLKGTNVYLDIVSVGATINIMLASVLASGQTIIENAAKEPHIVDVANFLNSMGADVKGAGTDVIKVRGVPTLKGGSYAIIPDQIEAGTFMAAVTATGGDILIKNIIPKHLECITAKLSEMGAIIEEFDDSIRVRRDGALNRVNIKTLPYPGFPTDMQPQLVAALILANGTSIVTESVWENRYRYIDELKRMGAKIQVDGKVAIIEGVQKLTGAPVRAWDLRAGAAMIIAGLTAHGYTEIEDVLHIERGYENIVEKFASLGADIKRFECPDEEEIAEPLKA